MSTSGAQNSDYGRVPETDWEAYWMRRCSELERRCEELWDELVGAFDERDAARRQRADLMAEVHRLNLEVMAHQVGAGYDKGHEHGLAAGLNHLGEGGSMAE